VLRPLAAATEAEVEAVPDEASDTQVREFATAFRRFWSGSILLPPTPGKAMRFPHLCVTSWGLLARANLC
jgi:hypothetical protein